MSIRTLLVDDEKLAIQGLQLRLAKQRAAESDDAGKIHELLEQAMSHARDLARGASAVKA